MLQPNPEFTLRPVLLVHFTARFDGHMVLTRSGITPPKVKPIWIKSGARLSIHSQGLHAVTDFGRGPRSSN